MVISVPVLEYFKPVSRNDMLSRNDELPQMSVAIWHIDRVVFYKIHSSLEVYCPLEGCTMFSREEGKRSRVAITYQLSAFTRLGA